LCEEVILLTEISDFKADDQDKLEEKSNQNEEAVKVNTFRNTVDVDGTDGDAENKEKINGELLNQDVEDLNLN
jgi:hypothetical protein